MQILITVLLCLCSLAMLTFAPLSTLMGADLLGQGLPATISGWLAIVSGVVTLLFAIAHSPVRRNLAAIACLSVLLVRAGRILVDPWAITEWSAESWLAFIVIEISPFLLTLGIAISQFQAATRAVS